MSSGAIRTLELAQEASFGSIDSTTGAPSTAGLTFGVVEEVQRGTLVPFGEPTLYTREDSRAGPHGSPPEYQTAVVSGTRLNHAQGTLEVTVPVRTLGDVSGAGAGDFTTYGGATGIPWTWMIDSMLAVDIFNGTGNSDDAVAGAVGANEFTPTNVGEYGIGQLIACDIDDRIEWSAVTDLGANVIHSPAMSRGLSNAAPDTVRHARTWYVPNDLETARGASLAARITGVGWCYLAFGIRAESMRLSLNGRLLLATFTLRCAHIEPATSSPVDDRTALGACSHMVDAYAVYSGAAPVNGNGAGATLARSTLALDEFEATLNIPLVGSGSTDGVLEVGEWEAGADPSFTMSITVSNPDTTIEADLRDAVRRSWLIGFGPNGAGNGAALMFPAGYMTSDPTLRDLGNGRVRQMVNLEAGRWWGDNSTSAPAGTPVRFGMSR